MAKKDAARAVLSNDDIRGVMLQYFYERNKNATSVMGKKGSAVKISDVKSELKTRHGLTQQEVQSNLTYLLSQGWVEEKDVQKQFRTKGGTVIPSVTIFYQITAAGIDKIEGPGEFTMPRFHGIKIDATGQNIITMGDGNQIDARFNDLGQTLVELRDAITESGAPENQKMSLVADIDTVQSQLAKPEPNHSIIAAAWQSIQLGAAIDGCVEFVEKVRHLISPFLR
jgi:predicted transcriptional regulator